MKTAITLLEADTPALLDRCLAVRQADFTGALGVPAEEERDSQGGQDIGAVRCLPQADGTLRLQRFCIRRDCRGQGAGRQTLREVEERFRREEFSAVALDAKCSAQGFYTACGYETVSAPFLEAGVLHVAMQRPL